MNLKAKKTTIWVVAVIIAATVIVFAILFIGKKQGKFGSPKTQPSEQEEPALLTQEEIQEIIKREAVPEAERTLLTQEEIQKIMNRKVPEAERNPLSDEEIREILNRSN